MTVSRKILLPNAPHIDDRGKIQNLILRQIDSVALISSISGSIRANHCHPDWHYCYILSGEILYFEREAGDGHIPEPEKFIAGDMFFTPELMEHAMVFTQNTEFITFANSVRNHENYERNIVRVQFITEKYVKDVLKL